MPERFIPIQDFEPSGIRETLQADSRTVWDVAHGEGEAFTLGSHGTELEVYPGAGVARVTTENARVELHRVPGYRLNEANHVIFEQGREQERLRMLVGSEGHVSLRPLLRATRSPTTRQTPPDGPQDRTSPARGSHDLTTPPKAEVPAAPEAEERGTVSVIGNIGRDLSFHERDGQLVCKFPLADNHPTRQTIWHDVVATEAVAEFVRDAHTSRDQAVTMRKGKPVEVVGYQEPKPGAKARKPDLHATRITRVSDRQYEAHLKNADRP